MFCQVVHPHLRSNASPRAGPDSGELDTGFFFLPLSEPVDSAEEVECNVISPSLKAFDFSIFSYIILIISTDH